MVDWKETHGYEMFMRYDFSPIANCDQSKPLSIRCPWHDTGLLLEWCELYHNDAMAQTKKRLATLAIKWRKNGTMGKKVSPSRAHVDVGCFLFL